MKNQLLNGLICFAAINIFLVLLGYRVLRKRLILIAWPMLPVAIAVIYFVFLHQHPVIKMLAIIATTFTGMKAIAAVQAYKDKPLTLKFKQWVVFSSGWAGMRPQPFETLGAPALPNAWPMIRFGISRIVVGAILILFAHWLVALHMSVTLTHIIVSVILLIGFSLILHFGLLGVSAGMWRLSGVNTYVLFRQPAKAKSLTEFWSKRWNIAFSEMTSVALFRPLKNKTGSAAALMIAFMFSGLLHELALSLPVNTGYGLPMLYFIIQGMLVLFERWMTIRQPKFLNNKLLATAWVLFWVVVPAPLLFHAAFIHEIVWPLAGLKW